MKGLSHLAILFAVLQILPNTAFQVSPDGNSNQPPSTPRTDGLVNEELANIGSKSPLSFQCTQTTVSNGDDFKSALQELFKGWKVPESPAIGCLFISPAFSSHLTELVILAQQLLGPETQLLTVVGGGVIGGGYEKEDSCSLSFLGGILPEESSVSLFSLTDNDDSSTTSATKNPKFAQSGVGRDRDPSHLIFADPYCKQMHGLLEQVDGIVAGGISIAGQKQSSLAIGTKVLPPGSLIGATFTGNIGLQVVVSQGCRPVGPTYRVTSVSGPAIHELDSERAIDQLQETMDATKKGSTMPIKDTDFLGGVHNGQRNSIDGDEKAPHDFILRQMTGFRPRSGSILVCGPQIQAGDFFRFHVQSKEIALKDWQTTLKRAKTERLFLGEQAGTALGALQISCMGRGSGLFGTPDVDLRHVERLLPPDTPVAGLLANAEIGPVGIRMGTSETCKSVLHGFASVVAMLCDYSEIKQQQISVVSCLGASSTDGSWE